jgi:FkbM family methyltransferase
MFLVLKNSLMLIPFNELFNKYNIKPSGVLHLGANLGQEAEEYYSKGIEEVIWVEAIPDVFKELQKNVSHIPNNFCINECLSDKDGDEVVFHISNNQSQSSSFLELGEHLNAHPEVHYVDSIKMKTITVRSMLGKYNISLGNDWFLNADLQGAELHAFRGMGSLLLKFKWVYCEINKKETYAGCGLVDDVDSYLLTYGFHRVETADWVGDCWTDALYIRY